MNKNLVDSILFNYDNAAMLWYWTLWPLLDPVALYMFSFVLVLESIIWAANQCS